MTIAFSFLTIIIATVTCSGVALWSGPIQKGFTWELKPKERCHSSTVAVRGSTVTQLRSIAMPRLMGVVLSIGWAVLSLREQQLWFAGAEVRGLSEPWGKRNAGRFALAELPDSRAMQRLFWAHLIATGESTLNEGFFSMPVWVSCLWLLLCRKGLYTERLRQYRKTATGSLISNGTTANCPALSSTAKLDGVF